MLRRLVLNEVPIYQLAMISHHSSLLRLQVKKQLRLNIQGQSDASF